ncbi:PDZ domain-containing protein [Bacillus sp. FJAT-49732]|uniref:PDZ domain-containing protein n=1 Tax=Lederbergia citrisecunda TaxID=2833583 RepID=A0A942YL76_9BACI|nr:PDZ domain-containing protein [Lederbergia citrisecunda]MBS4200357.1 PDZ domain-containing protein [Lederbergia citrisecunda]
MAEIWLLEIAKGIGRLFLHPILYFSILLAITAGYFRVKRERRDFHVRVHGLFHELQSLLPAGFAAGLILSLLFVSLGLTIPFPIIAFIAILTLILGLVGNARLLSPALTIGLALLFLFVAHIFSFEIPYFNNSLTSIDPSFFMGTAILLGILTITEGILMLKNGLKDVSPKLRKSRRGLTVGALQTKRLWLLPFFLFLPSGPINAPFEWWPVINWGTESYSFILVPFLLGFQQQIQTTLPGNVVKRLGKHVLSLGIVITAIGSVSFLMPYYIPAIAAFLAIIGRLLISYFHRVREGSTLYYFTPKNSGIMVLDVLPESPADKMGLKTGEIIQTCNNIKVHNKQDLYEALLKNRAYCKLEVFDKNGEIRLVQRALYEGDHHELGILFIEKRDMYMPEKAV